MAKLTREEVRKLFERSKNDREIIVGSEVRALCALALAALDQRGADCDARSPAPVVVPRAVEEVRTNYIPTIEFGLVVDYRFALGHAKELDRLRAENEKLQAKARRLEALERAVNEHNDDCRASCKWRYENDRCTHKDPDGLFRYYNKRCSDCSEDMVIELEKEPGT